MADGLHIVVVDRAGQRHRLPALEGYRVMEIIRDWGQDIRAECGGACACATCHVWVADAWIDSRVRHNYGHLYGTLSPRHDLAAIANRAVIAG